MTEEERWLDNARRQAPAAEEFERAFLARKNMARKLRESASTFRRQQTHTLPAMAGFIERHIKELDEAAAMFD